MEPIERLGKIGACEEAIRFVRENPTVQSWPELARKSQRLDWLIWLLWRHSESGFSLGDTKVERKRALVRFACWCARRALPKFEAKYPNDKRPAKAIEAAEKWYESPVQENAVAAVAADAADAAAFAAFAFSAAVAAVAADAADAAAFAAFAFTGAAVAVADRAAEKAAEIEELLRMAGEMTKGRRGDVHRQGGRVTRPFIDQDGTSLITIDRNLPPGATGYTYVESPESKAHKLTRFLPYLLFWLVVAVVIIAVVSGLVELLTGTQSGGL